MLNLKMFELLKRARQENQKLMREAKFVGCKVISGSELFINQAARQFGLWTGQPALIGTTREVLLEHLGKIS